LSSTPTLDQPPTDLSVVNDRRLSAATAGLVAIAIVFPRSSTIVFMIPIIVAVLALSRQRRARLPKLELSGLAIALLAFGAWSLVSALWSAAPYASLTKPLYVIGGIIGMSALRGLIQASSTATLRAIALGFVSGVMMGGGIVAIELMTNQALERFAYNTVPGAIKGMEKHVSIQNGVVVTIGETNINRRITVVAMLLIPAMFVVSILAKDRMRWVGVSVLALIAGAVMFGFHQSSQAALVAAALAFGLAQVSRIWSIRLAGAAWCVSTLLVVPLIFWAHSTDVHKAPEKLFNSARHRIVIWNTTAEQIIKAPILGIGADATAAHTLQTTTAREKRGQQASKDGDYEKSTARHAHNVFLQVWYELGGIGAALLTAVGLAALVAISRSSAAIQPAYLAQFAAIAGMIAFSFSLWQLWFQGAIGIGALATVLGAVLAERGAAAQSNRQDRIVS
jgi:hypothetical protein